MNFLPFPELKTKRLRLRRVVESDYNVILYLRSDGEINKYIYRPENRKTKTQSDALEFIKKINLEEENGLSITWGMTVDGTSGLIGSICLWNISKENKTAEVGYSMNPNYQGTGLMSEVLKSTLSFGFNKINLIGVTAYTHDENKSSKNLLIRNGFKLVEGEIDKGNSSNIIFEILKTTV